MKKILLLLFTITSLSAKAQTNVYHPFPDSAAMWNINNSYMCWLSPYNMVYQDYSIIMPGDTIIGSETYHKLVIPVLQTIHSSCAPGTTYLNIYKGAIREDTAARKVFIVPPAANTEELLYDFTMQVGDTVRGYIESQQQFNPDIVLSIDSVLVGNNYRKRWNIDNQYSISFIEGIGSTYGLVEYSFSSATDQLMISISCFQQNGQTLYPDTLSNCLQIGILFDGINSDDTDSDLLSVFPNPSEGSANLDFRKSTGGEIVLTDLSGRIILQQRIANQSRFSIENLESGTYMLTVLDEKNKTVSRKKIICI